MASPIGHYYWATEHRAQTINAITCWHYTHIQYMCWCDWYVYTNFTYIPSGLVRNLWWLMPSVLSACLIHILQVTLVPLGVVNLYTDNIIKLVTDALIVLFKCYFYLWVPFIGNKYICGRVWAIVDLYGNNMHIYGFVFLNNWLVSMTCYTYWWL